MMKLKPKSQLQRRYTLFYIFGFSNLHYCPITIYSYDSFVSATDKEEEKSV